MCTPRGNTSGILASFNKPQGLPTYLQQPLLQHASPSNASTTPKKTIHNRMPTLDLNKSYSPSQVNPMLNTQPKSLEQRYGLIADENAEAIVDLSVADLTPDEQEHLAYHILRDLTDNLKPLSGSEYLIVVPAILFALGACATSKNFGDKFVEGLESLLSSFKASPETTKTGVAWGIAAANVCAQFSLSTNSVITVLTRILRIRQRSADAKLNPALEDANKTANKYDKPLTKKEKAILLTVPFSAAATYKMGFDTFSGEYGPGVGHSVGALRYGSASLVNLNFTHDQVYRWRGDNEQLTMINLLKDAKKHLNRLADDAMQPLAFIQALQQNNLLKQLNGKNTNPVENDTAKKQIEALVNELLQSTPFIEAQNNVGGPGGCTKSDVVQWVSMILGCLVSLTNFKAGTRVPELFGLPVPNDLVDFFSNISADWTLGVAGLGLLLGIPPWFVNIIINAKSCLNFANGISAFINDVRVNGRDALKKYWSADGALVAALFVTSIGYGAGNGGSGYKYPPLNIAPIPIINLLLSSAVFTALGNLSLQGAVAKVRDRVDDDLLQRAINTEDLVDFYDQILTPSQQNTLRRLLVNNINLAFDSQIASYNKLQDGAVNSMFSEELRNNLENRYNTDLSSIVTETSAISKSAESEHIDIAIDSMTTITNKSSLSSIRVDPLIQATPPLLPKQTASQLTDSPDLQSRTPGGNYNNSPLFNSLSPTLFHSGSPSNPNNVRHQRKHHHPTAHHSILGSETGMDGFSTNLMAPTRSPNAVSPRGTHSQPHTPGLYSSTPVNQHTDNNTTSYLSPKLGSSQ